MSTNNTSTNTNPSTNTTNVKQYTQKNKTAQSDTNEQVKPTKQATMNTTAKHEVIDGKKVKEDPEQDVQQTKNKDDQAPADSSAQQPTKKRRRRRGKKDKEKKQMAFILANSQLSLGANSFVPKDFANKDDKDSSDDEDQQSEDERDQSLETNQKKESETNDASQEAKPIQEEQKKTDESSSLAYNVNAPSFNMSASVFNPTASSKRVNTSSAQNTNQQKEVPKSSKSKKQNRSSSRNANAKPQPVQQYQPKVVSAEDQGGYKNPHQVSDPQKQLEILKKKEVAVREEQKKKVYTLEFMMTIRTDFKDRPVNMALLDFPHKKRSNLFRQEPMSEIDKFNKSVGQIRILLNKLAKENFETIKDKIMKDFDYTPSLLYELMKIIFMKATTESAYLQYYVRLCILLFRRFNDKDNVEMNFRKLLLTRCEKQFYKMLEKERGDRRTRRASLDEIDARINSKVGNETGKESDFNKQMLYVFDEQEIKIREQAQMHGNMQLIVELFKNNQIKAGILITCIDDLVEDIEHEQNLLVLIKMLLVLADHMCNLAKEQKASGEPDLKKNSKGAQITLNYIDYVLQTIFKHRKNEKFESWLKFKIQDLIDEYNKKWKYVIYAQRQEDNDGFVQMYVPKESILSEEVVASQKGRPRRGSKAASNKVGYIYQKKNQQKEEEKPSTSAGKNQKQFQTKMKSLLSGLKPQGNDEEDSQSEDEHATDFVNRKVSMNRVNVVGLDFERYNNLKPSPEIKRKIQNLFMEFNNSNDSKHAAGEFIDICKTTGIQRSMCYGLILNNAFSLDSAGWSSIFSLVIDKFYVEEKLLESIDLIEGVNVSMGNFQDMLIDYPNAKDYVFGMFDKLHSLDLLEETQLANYKKHVENLQNMDYDSC